MIQEFKEFISRGNVLDLAVGVIIGGAFTSIVKALVNYLINPLIGLCVGGIDFSDWSFKIFDATFKIGSFINSVINFLIIAFVVFLIVKFVNKLMPKPKEDDEEEIVPDNTELYLKEIRDALVNNNENKASSINNKKSL
ncbi:large-conductance mechanosensitive channel protein MscL [Pediococcus pentosaceus]|uniref:large-conductance mechanosensitive channel protein MscL n=1 Tax=Pediococcus pentosaceus TaxID=1255 RepID=UPI001C7CAB14|nr:large-conductance mechanosensitive channel protein MscL [Pediococcus pentosaceus]QYY85488.1 large-conductance mechanosensitive channel protein MscL [Pediococcus pentosaceus]